jgi:hemerythrin-like domain-containing protein
LSFKTQKLKNLAMKRINIFNQVHKGLRVALYETATSLQQADFTSETESDEALAQVKEVIMLFNEQARKEDQFILPVLFQFEPSVVDASKQEHIISVALSGNLNAAINRFEGLLKAADRVTAGKRINIDFVEFMVFNLQHMSKEEDVLNKLLWRYYSDAEIQQIQQQIAESTEPWHQDFFAKWMLRGLNVAEAAAWLHSVERTAPEVVYRTLFRKASQELSKSRFRKLAEYLTETAVLN